MFLGARSYKYTFSGNLPNNPIGYILLFLCCRGGNVTQRG